jgi:glycerophosphoryl diester phosphodiesterase
MEIIGHRGAKGLARENSLDAFKLAIENNVDAIETDVRLHGKELVLSHDATVITEKYTKLSDLFTLVNGSIPVNLEVKEERAIKLLKPFVKKYKGKVIFSSFDFGILQSLRKTFPDHQIAVLEKWSGIRAVAEASLINTRRLHINQNWLWSNFVRSLNHKGYDLYAYTVNSVERAEELENWGVKGIFTDYPDRFKLYNKR